MYNKVMNYQDIVVVEDFEEAEQFRFESNDEPVEVGTPVGFESIVRGPVGNGHLQRGRGEVQILMTCFDGIYFIENE